jgi:hypothetical protein
MPGTEFPRRKRCASKTTAQRTPSRKHLLVERLTDQFDAFTTAAKVLIERTRGEAEWIGSFAQ